MPRAERMAHAGRALKGAEVRGLETPDKGGESLGVRSSGLIRTLFGQTDWDWGIECLSRTLATG